MRETFRKIRYPGTCSCGPNQVAKMIIKGSALLIQPGSEEAVLTRLKDFPAVTFHVKSESGAELVVNLEAPDTGALDDLCDELKRRIPEIVDIAHLYVNFEDEIIKLVSGNMDASSLQNPDFDSE